MTVPAGAVDQPTSFSITNIPASEFGLGQGSAAGSPVLDVVNLGPEGAAPFDPRVTVQFSWTPAQLATLGIVENKLRAY